MMITTQAGDVLDALCLRYLGTEQAVAEVLKRNPQLAGLDEQGLPAGVVIDMGEAPLPAAERPPTPVTEVQLWD